MVDTLVCIYTCEADRPLLNDFYRSPVGLYLREMPEARLVEVYADASLAHSVVSDDRIIVDTPERYEALSLKTAKMIACAVRSIEFERLLKIDVTCVRKDFSHPKYAGRKPLDLKKLVYFIKNADHNKHYDGFISHSAATRENAETWASKKGGKINYFRVFGDEPMPPFFSGSCYFISREFASFIAWHGFDYANEHVKFMLGSEDTMIGRLYREFMEALDQGAMPLSRLPVP